MRDVYKIAMAFACALVAFNSYGQSCTAKIKPTSSSICPGVPSQLLVLVQDTSGDSSLTTEYDAYYQQRGNMFNIVAKEDIVVTGFDMNCQDTTQDFAVYYKKGAFEGDERDSSNWTSLGRAKPVMGNGFDTATHIPLQVSVRISKGDTAGFYISSTTQAYVYYGIGVAQGAVFKQDKSMQILEGIGLDWPFTGSSTGAIFTPRIWNGTVHYHRASEVKYSWSTKDTTPTTDVTIYKKTPVYVTITKGSCTAYDTLDLDLSEQITFGLGNDTIVCSGSSVKLDGGKFAGGKVTWKPGNTTGRYKTITKPGRVSAFLTSAHGCRYYDTLYVTEVSSPSVNLGKDFNLCPDDTVELDAGGFPSGTIVWSTNETTQKIKISTPGKYTATVTDSGCVTVAEVNVGSAQNLMVALGNDVEVCEGDTVTLVNGNHSPDLSYEWSTTHVGSSLDIYGSGTYSVIATDTNGCTGFDTLVAFYHNNPVPGLGGVLEACKGDTVKLDAGMHGSNTTWAWSTSESTQTIEVTKTDIYSVTVVDSFGCTTTEDLDMTFRKLPFVNLGLKQSFCDGDSAKLDAGFDDGYTTYKWSNGASDKVIYAKRTGTFEVTVTDSFGCKRSDDVDITVFDIPVLNLGADTAICKGTMLTLDAGTHAITKWSTSDKTRTITVSAGTYSVQVSNAFGCQNTDEIEITETDVPVASFSASDVGGQNVSFTNNSTNGDSYSWDFGDGSALSTEESPSHWYKKDTVYTVELSVTNKCGTTKTTETVTVLPSGIGTPNQPQLTLYPNPSKGWLVLDMSELNSNANVNLYDMNGKQVQLQLNNLGNGRIELQLPASSTSGMYLLSVKTENAIYNHKVLVEM